MVTTRRSSALQAAVSAAEAGDNGSLETIGKRKPGDESPVNSNIQDNKRRKKSTIQVSEDEVEEDAVETAPKKHFRFGSEEPEIPETAENTQQEEPTSAQQHDEEESSDDEAPETVDNSAELSRIKEEAKRREKARQIEEQLKKEKRRQLDEARKLQAQASGKRKEVSVAATTPGVGSPVEDLVSESSATLQGSFTQDGRRPTLPALLPDDILNAVPDVRPPTPPPEAEAFAQKKPTKLRFLDKKEKAPKDVRMGDVAIRVLDSDNSRKKSGTALPPKASKTGRTAKDAWLKQARSTGHINGLRMVKSGSKGFVRK